MIFQDRVDAGRRLATLLTDYASRPDLLVLGLPRGGVPVAHEIARALNAPLDLFMVRKLGVPGHEELAMGAVATGGTRVINQQVVAALGITESAVEEATAEARRELERRERAYRDDRPPPDVRGRTVILVDDGLATGSTMRAAIKALRQLGPHRIVVAVPVAAPESCRDLRDEVDDLVCAVTPQPFYAVGDWYEDFSQTSDEEVQELLQEGLKPRAAGPSFVEGRQGKMEGEGRAKGYEESDQAVRVPAGPVKLEGNLAVPAGARGVVLFAHGSGSSRISPRNRYVARVLHEEGLATLLMDLLTNEEEIIDRQTAHLRFDIGLLAGRLVAATDWLGGHPDTGRLPIGYFGASTGAGAALMAAANRPDVVRAVVSRGGRPDLAGPALEMVKAPTLLIVGEEDGPVIALNREAMARLPVEKRLDIVPRATHLFEEPGALEEVALLAREWFLRHLGTAGQERPEPRAA